MYIYGSIANPLCVTAVASLKIYEDGRKEFRVLNCISQHPQTSMRSSVYDSQFCVGCLSPPELPEKKKWTHNNNSSSSSTESDVYVFSRYWDVVSDKSLFAHFLGIFVAPLFECMRALLIYLLLAIFHAQRFQGEAQGSSSTALILGLAGPQLRTKLLRLVVLMTACDVLTRRITLWIKSGLLVTVMSFASVLLDQLALVALYTSLEQLYPSLADAFRSLLSFELGISAVNMAAIQLGFLEVRDQWHPAFKEVSRWDFHFRYAVFLCGVGKEALIHLLLLLPFQNQDQDQDQDEALQTRTRLALMWRMVAYLLVPLFTISTGIDFVRGVATLLHLLQYPWLSMKKLVGGGGSGRTGAGRDTLKH